jgi:hypothetical protein
MGIQVHFCRIETQRNPKLDAVIVHILKMKWEKELEERWLVGCRRAEQPFKNQVSRKRL